MVGTVTDFVLVFYLGPSIYFHLPCFRWHIKSRSRQCCRNRCQGGLWGVNSNPPSWCVGSCWGPSQGRWFVDMHTFMYSSLSSRTIWIRSCDNYCSTWCTYVWRCYSQVSLGRFPVARCCRAHQEHLSFWRLLTCFSWGTWCCSLFSVGFSNLHYCDYRRECSSLLYILFPNRE